MDWELLAKIMSNMGQGREASRHLPQGISSGVAAGPMQEQPPEDLSGQTERAFARSGRAAAGPPPPMREMDRPRTPRPDHWRTASNPPGALPEIDLSGPSPAAGPTPTSPADFAEFLLGQNPVPGVGMFGAGPEGGQTVFHPEGQDPGVLVNYGPPGLQTSVSANLTPQQLEIISELQRIFQGGESQITGMGSSTSQAGGGSTAEEMPLAQPDLMSMARRVAGRGRRP